MIISDKIYIDCSKESLDETILNDLTYDNPEYYKRMNMGLSVKKVPKKIYSYSYDPNTRVLAISRGEALNVKKYISKFTYNFNHPDHPENIQYVNNDFELDEYQQGAVKAMTIDGYRQGIIHAVTSAGKSLMILKTAADLKQRTLIVVHRKLLMTQLLEDIDKYIRDEKGEKIKPGIIASGKVTIGPITIAIDRTLAKHIDEYKDSFGVTILDECHIAPSDTLFILINKINSTYRFGFSGTLKRKDQKEFLIFSTFGKVIYTISKDQLIDKGRIVPVKVRIIDSYTKFNYDQVVESLTIQGNRNPTQAARHLLDRTLINDNIRNDLILKNITDLQGKILVLSRFVEPCYFLQKRLKEVYGYNSGIITGKDSKEASKAYEEMKHGDLQIIFATIGCVSTGVSISDLSHIVLISPMYSNELLLHQIRGRLMRKSEGKEFGTLHYIYDKYIYDDRKLNKFIKIMNS